MSFWTTGVPAAKTLPKYVAGVAHPTDWLMRFSASDASSLWQDESRTIQATPGDVVRAWNQPGNPVGADVMDRHGAVDPDPILVNAGPRLAVSWTPINARSLKQNSNAGGAPVTSVVPSGTNPVFSWVVAHDFVVSGASLERFVSWGDTDLELRAHNQGGGTVEWTFGGSLAQDVHESVSPAPVPAVLFLWYSGGVLYIQRDNGTVYSNDISGAISVDNGSGALNRSLRVGTSFDVEVSELGMYDYILDANQRTALYNFLVSEHNL